MKITNKANLPKPLYNAIVDVSNSYDSGDIPIHYSATQLLKPAHMVALQSKHRGEITEDALDRLWAVRGSAIHAIIEKANRYQMLTEQRYTAKLHGWVIGGGVDCYYDNTILDFKETSVWSIIYRSRQEEWTQQLNIYAWLMRKAGYQVDKLQIVAMLRDWSKSKARYDREYPQQQVIVMLLQVWDDRKTEGFISERINEMESAKVGEITDCKPNERWEVGEVWAVKKKGVKKALKLHTYKFDAEKHLENLGSGGYTIEHRPGVRQRCEDYCNVACFCPSYQKYLEDK